MIPSRNLRDAQPGADERRDNLIAHEAQWRFDRALRRARWMRRIRRLTRSPGELLELSDLPPACPIHGRHAAGLQYVPIAQIRGTEGRSRDFDRDFNPFNGYNRDRWKGIYLAWEKGIEMPPVDLIQVGDVYYVRDGHHRISIAKLFGQTDIRAEVTTWDTHQACSCDILALLSQSPVEQSH